MKIYYSAIFACLFFTACENSKTKGDADDFDFTKPPAAIESATFTSDIVNNETITILSKAEPATLLESSESELKGATTYINFSDPDACTWNPNICSNTFVTWPGYIQSTGYGEWGYAWMSNGPGTSFISYGTGDHYHIMGFVFPETEPNPRHTAMFGTDWFAFYMQRSGVGRINFDLTGIRVHGSVPIILKFKKANNTWWYWASLGPGTWNLPGALNIKELHIRAASNNSADKYSIDNIKVKGL